MRELFGRGRVRRVLGHDQIDEEHDGQRDAGKAKHRVPPEHDGEAGGEQRREHGARIAHSGKPHRLALMLGRVPAAGEGQCDRKAGPGKAEHYPQRERAGEAGNPHQPSAEQPGDDDHLADRAGALGTDAVDKQAVDDAQQRPGERRHRDHQPLLRRAEAEVGGDRGREWAEDDPHHEGEVEIHKGCDQRRPVPAGPEIRFGRRSRPRFCRRHRPSPSCDGQ